MTKANKSFHETISTILSVRFRNGWEHVLSAPLLSVLYCQSTGLILQSRFSFPKFYHIICPIFWTGATSCVQFLGQVGNFVWNIDGMGGKWYYHFRGATDRRLARLTFYVTLKVTAKFVRLGRLFSFAIVSCSTGWIISFSSSSFNMY